MNPRPEEYYQTSKMFKIEGYLKIGFIISTLLYLPISYFKIVQLSIAVTASIMGLIRQKGPVKLSKDYLISSILTDFGSSLLYILLIAFLENPSMAFFLPLDVYFAIGASEFITRSKLESLLKFEKVKSIIGVILQTKEDLKKARIYVEVFVFLYLIVLTCLRKIGLLPVLIAFNYLRIRGMSNLGKQVYWTFKVDLETVLVRVPYLAKAFGWFFGVLSG